MSRELSAEVHSKIGQVSDGDQLVAHADDNVCLQKCVKN